ncbi:hypothetical protein HYC85_012813 [Camellia sinensis]|uniref:RRM domain-containing protein n=1 Tax=Camellia sinensis TaxID=4442 RepID=A0A7J7HD24_CAMSI|nr:hypothetical protein HYC85_012813 [Camellia sinensis]
MACWPPPHSTGHGLRPPAVFCCHRPNSPNYNEPKTNRTGLILPGRSGTTSADDLFPLFKKYGKVVVVFIPRDRRTGDSRGFAFVWYKYADEAQKAVDKLDGRVVDGREIMVQFAKYGPNAEKILDFIEMLEREDSRISIKVKRQLKKPESSTKEKTNKAHNEPHLLYI